MAPVATSGLLAALLGASLAAACHRTTPATHAAPAPETVLLRLRAQVGQTRRFRLEIANYMRMGPGEPPSSDNAAPMSRMVEFTTETVTSIAGDTITVQTTTDSGRMEMPNLPVPPEMLRQFDSLARGVTIVSRMDSRGRMFSWESRGSPQLEAQMAALRRVAAPFDTAGGAPTAYRRLPDQPVRVGDVWADTITYPGFGGAAPRQGIATCRLERIEILGGRRSAVLSFDMTTPPMKLEQPSSMTSGPMHMVFEAYLDLDAGWIVRNSMTMSGAMHSAMGDMSMRMVMRQTPLEEKP
jgi:hypothetical protein